MNEAKHAGAEEFEREQRTVVYAAEPRTHAVVEGQSRPAPEATRQRGAVRERTSVLEQGSQAAIACYRAIFDQVPDGIVVFGENGACLEANPAACRLVGYSIEELRSMRLGDLVARDDHDGWRDAFASLRQADSTVCELELRRKDGVLVPVEAHMTAIELPDGAVYVAAWRDLTQRRALEQRRREFLAMVTHDLRNPLTSIRGYAQLLQRRAIYNEWAVEIILAQTSVLDRLLQRLLETATLQAGRGAVMVMRRPLHPDRSGAGDGSPL